MTTMTLVKISPLNGVNVLTVCKQLYCRCTTNHFSRKYSCFKLQMASNDRDNADKPISVTPFRRISGRKLINSNESNQVGQQTTTESEEYFYASECSLQRPSTFEDELLVKRLLKDILADREANFSNWVVENKVKNLCTLYKCLLKPHKEGFLKDLACDHAIDHLLVTKTAKSLTELKQEECEERQVLKVEERLKNLLTPQYSWLFIHMGRLEKGVKFLVDLRTDVLAMVSDLDLTDPLLMPMQQLNATLKEMLSLWFSVGFLTLERVTWRSPCEMLEKISGYEAVHPVRNWTDLKRRVGPYRRCFVFTHSSMPDEPLVVLHTALSDEISQSMRGIVTAVSRMSVDLSTETGLVVDCQVEDPNCVKAAIFYSISSTQKGLQGSMTS